MYKYGLCILCTILTCSVNAQKLPNTQETSQWLSSTAKVDGKLSEWPGSLQAYNKATLVEYTLANDNKTLYLAIRSKDKTATAKILAGGISLILNSSGKIKGSEITFPATKSTYSYVKTGWPVKTFNILTDSTAIRNEIQQLKEIKVLGLKGITDSLLSIYNEYGIESKLSYTNETLVCELAIPLSLIGLSQKTPAELTYSIKLNGVPVPPRPANIPMPQQLPPPVVIQRGGGDETEIQFGTYLNGKYSLAKKE